MNTLPTPQFHQQIASQLLAREAELRGYVQAATSNSMGREDEPTDVQDTKDVAAMETRNAVEDVSLQRASDELRQTREALRRLEDGSYGACAECGQPIGEGRLLALPACALCVSCQTVLEQAGGPAAAGGPASR